MRCKLWLGSVESKETLSWGKGEKEWKWKGGAIQQLLVKLHRPFKQNNRIQSNMMHKNISSSIRVLYQQTAFFLSSERTVEVCLVEHVPHHIIEIIVHDPVEQREAPRIYLNEKFLETTMNEEEVAKQVSQARIVFRRRESLDVAKLQRDAVDKVKVSYLLNRMKLRDSKAPHNATMDDDNQSFGFKDIAQSIFESDSLCSKPTNLDPYQVHRLQVTTK